MGVSPIFFFKFFLSPECRRIYQVWCFLPGKFKMEKVIFFRWPFFFCIYLLKCIYIKIYELIGCEGPLWMIKIPDIICVRFGF